MQFPQITNVMNLLSAKLLVGAETSRDVFLPTCQSVLEQETEPSAVLIAGTKPRWKGGGFTLRQNIFADLQPGDL